MTALIALLLTLAPPPDDPSPAEALGWPVSLADESAPGLQEQDRRNEFSININLWPILESTTLPTGERRTALWPLFHVSTNPDGSNHSWHVLTFLAGETYHMFLPLYYVVDDNVGVLPPVFLGGKDYWASVPLLSGSWSYADGDRATWVTPLFHWTGGADGGFRNMHALIYYQSQTAWSIPPLLSGSWSYPDGARATWVTPLFHYTSDLEGGLVNMHAGVYFQSRSSWSIPPLLVWSQTRESGRNTLWVTPLFHYTQEETGDLADMHALLYFQGHNYWMIPPLFGGGTTSEGHRVTWITPLFHWTADKDGNVDNYHAGVYFSWKDWWTIPPLLTFGWSEHNGESWVMSALLFWLHFDKEGGMDSTTLFPIFFWVRDHHWFALPIFSGYYNDKGSGDVTWITPLYHSSHDAGGRLDAWHVGIFFAGDGYWALPPLFTWWNRFDNGATALWVTPLFHLTLDPKDECVSLHVFPFFLGQDYWAVPPLFTWQTTYTNGVTATWVTPLFHSTTDANGEITSLHVFPLFFYEKDKYWTIPPLCAGQGPLEDGSFNTWLTPLYHSVVDKDGALSQLHVTPFWYWEKNRYWTSPLLLSGGGLHADGAWSTWITPLYHHTLAKDGDLESLHVFPLWMWKKDDYWVAPPLLTGGGTKTDGSTTLYVGPLYHHEYGPDGTLKNRHILNYFDGDTYHTFFPIFYDWQGKDQVRHTMVPPVYVRTEEANGDVTTSLPWPIITARTGKALDTSLGMELRPFLYQDAGRDHEFNFLWRILSILHEEESTRVMAGPLWRSEKPDREDAMMKFQILGGLFARDCNYETGRYRYRIFWAIPLGANLMTP